MKSSKNIIFSIVAAASIAMSVGWLRSRSALFRLSNIELIPEPQAELKEQMLKVVAPSLGKSLHLVALDELGLKLTHIPQIKVKEIVRRWPSTIELYYSIREPVVQIEHNGLWWGHDVEAEKIIPIDNIETLPKLVYRGYRANQDDASRSQGALEIDGVRTKIPKEAFKFFGKLKQANEIEIWSFYVWDEYDGLTLLPKNPKFAQIKLGLNDFDSRYQRAKIAYNHLTQQGAESGILDAAYQRRVVASLPNSKKGLKSK